jgi:hypothetical protein
VIHLALRICARLAGAEVGKLSQLRSAGLSIWPVA